MYEPIMYRTLLSGDNLYSKNDHHDAVLYSADNVQYIDILETIFVHWSPGSSQKVVLLRFLDVIAPYAGNRLVVQLFGNQRYSYRLLSAVHIYKTSLPDTILLQSIILVVDQFCLTTRMELIIG